MRVFLRFFSRLFLFLFLFCFIEMEGDQKFIDGCYLPKDPHNGEATLVSFHFYRFLLFTLMLVVAGPLVYRLTAAFFDLERDFKPPAIHFQDLTNGLMYAYLVFTLGNYSHTFGWVTLVSYLLGLLGYSALVEIPFLRVSLPGWRSWSVKAWIVHLVGLLLILAAAGVHIRWAYMAAILRWYLPLFALATATVWSTVVVQKAQHFCIDHQRPHGLGLEPCIRRAALGLLISRNRPARDNTQLAIELRQRAEQYNNSEDDDRSHSSTSQLNMPPDDLNPVGTMSRLQKQQLIERRLQHLHYLNVRPDQPMPLLKYTLHLHHWQIFYLLAFFTRFDYLASRICSGIVLGIYTHGIAAYGYHPMMEPLK